MLSLCSSSEGKLASLDAEVETRREALVARFNQFEIDEVIVIRFGRDSRDGGEDGA